MRLHADIVNVAGILLILVEIGLANDIAAFHRPVFLGIGEEESRAGVGERATRGDVLVRDRADRIGVETSAFAHVAGCDAAVAKRHDHRIVGETWLDVQRALDLTTAHGEFVDAPVFLADRKFVFLNACDLEC